MTTSEKTHKRDLKKWKKEMAQTETVMKPMEYSEYSEYSESSIMADFEDSWMD